MRKSRGQILIPALLMFPTLMLFVYLIYETAKLSREKIRHQFAIDSAAFVEMTNYSDFLNRTAYVNGAFPMRIFYEGFHSTPLNNMGKSSCDAAVNKYATGGSVALDDVLYAEGAFPRDSRNPYSEPPGSASWKIQFDPASQRGGANATTPGSAAFNSPNAQQDSSGKNCGQSPCLTLISEQTANCWNINFDDATSVMNLYMQIYQLLGSVESAQFSVLQSLATGHQFFTKSYWLNLGTQQALGEANGATSFPPVDFLGGVQMHCVAGIFYYANKLIPGNPFQPYGIFNNYPGYPMPSSISGCDGLFQLATVNPAVITSTERGSPYPGWVAAIRWSPPTNSFNVDVNQFTPTVHATVSLWPGAAQEAAVWPNPTPHFQTRLYP